MRVKIHIIKEVCHTGEGGILDLSDADWRKYGDQRGLDTLVVHTANAECSLLVSTV